MSTLIRDLSRETPRVGPLVYILFVALVMLACASVYATEDHTDILIQGALWIAAGVTLAALLCRRKCRGRF